MSREFQWCVARETPPFQHYNHTSYSSVHCVNRTRNPETTLHVLTKLACLRAYFQESTRCRVQTVDTEINPSKVQYAKNTGLGYTGLV